MSSELHSAGTPIEDIQVHLSYRIVELFSDGLYASANKAIEELVANAFDAGAPRVHVVMSPDRGDPSAFIAIIDDGTSMDTKGLHQHWVIGESTKRQNESKSGRRQIGKFGIGKLATFVLARHFTLVCKVKGKYHAVTMDYDVIPKGTGKGISTDEPVTLPLRKLTRAQARGALALLVDGASAAFPLFGDGAPESWTVAIMTNLKPKATELQKGRLRWVLRTAMPLGDDFVLYLDGERVHAAKSDVARQKRWTIGKDLTTLQKPGPDDLEVETDVSAAADHKHGLVHPALGRITGSMEIYADALTASKETYGRSHGFFVYVRKRLVNLDDPLFGLKALRHGTFVRFRMVLHADRLDDELRSNREAVRDGPLVTVVRQILHGAFNVARNWLDEREGENGGGGGGATGRISSTPGSLTRKPIVAAVAATLSSPNVKLRHIEVPRLQENEKEAFLEEVRARAETEQGLVLAVELEDLAQGDPVAVLDVTSGRLRINGLHPFVASYRDEFTEGLEVLALFGMSEVLAEAHLHELGVPSNMIRDILERRDEVLRAFARYFRRTAHTVAEELLAATHDQDGLEERLVEAFQVMGFEAVRIGGNGKPDGKAEARLAGSSEGPRRYAVTLEAKSKQQTGKKVSAKSVGVSTLARHREDYDCEHAVVVGPDFPTGKEDAAVLKEIRADRENTGKSITLVRIKDLARLVRAVSLRAVGLDDLRELFESCSSPDESAVWIDAIAKKAAPAALDYKAVLETIWDLQHSDPNEAVEYGSVKTALKIQKKIDLQKAEIIILCKAIERFTDQLRARDTSVELRQRPDKVIAAIRKEWSAYPKHERTGSIFKFRD